MSTPERGQVFGSCLTRRLFVTVKEDSFYFRVLVNAGVKTNTEYEIVGALGNDLLLLTGEGALVNVYPSHLKVTRSEDIKVQVEVFN